MDHTTERKRMIVPAITLEHLPTHRLGIAIIGSTGSIGRQTLQVIDQHPERFTVVSLASGSISPLLAQQVSTYRPLIVAADSHAEHDGLIDRPVLFGEEGLIAATTHPEIDIVVVASSGHAAIIPTARAIEAGKTIALANKEAIVCAGELIVDLALQHNVQIRPVDSEHSAIWQALGLSDGRDISRLILTASGGPFRETPIEELSRVTAEQALSHPTWSMGGKITIDSATMMNKGLELIEAHWLFGMSYDALDVVIHPESIVHSIVEFSDFSQVAQLSLPDMRLPIQYALTYPRHASSPCRRLSLADAGTLRFFEPDIVRFPSLRLAREAGYAGQTYPTVLSVADEVAVKAFMDGAIRFVDIAEVVERALTIHQPWPLADFDALADADAWGRQAAEQIVTLIAMEPSGSS